VNGVETQHRTNQPQAKSDEKPTKLQNKKQGKNTLSFTVGSLLKVYLFCP